MSRPDWFVCEKCLFSEAFVNNPDYIGCHHTRQPGHEEIMLHKEYFCENWTCKNCWSVWNDWNWDKETDKDYHIDHSKCEKVEIR